MDSSVVLGSAVGVAGLIGLKKYFGGAVCKVRRDLTGKVAVITGGNTGIGRETALELARANCEVLIGARDEQKCRDAVTYIKANLGNNNVHYLQLDLSSR